MNEERLRKADEILANVAAAIDGRVMHRDPRDRRAQLCWFADELKRAARELDDLLTDEAD
jgi:hypothetical protein